MKSPARSGTTLKLKGACTDKARVKTRALVTTSLGVLAVTALVAGCGGGKGKSSGPAAVGPTSSCDQPTIHDRYIGFRVGKPKDWILDSTGGAVVVKRDPAGKELALIYPVVLSGDRTLKSLFNTYTGVLDATAQADGGGLDFRVTERDKKRIQGKVDGTFAGTKVKGRAQVSEAGNQTVFSTYWAPKNELGDEEKVLSAIVGCYRGEQGTPLEVHKGSYFTASIPSGWRVTAETQNGIDIVAPSEEGSVSFAYVTNAPGVTNPEEYRDWTLGTIGLESSRVLATQDLGSVTDQLGTSWSTEASEFEGTVRGDQVHGVIAIGVGNTAYGSFTGMASVRAAKVDDWDKLAGVLAAVQDSIRLISTGGGSSTPGAGVSLPSNQPNENPLTSSYEYRNQVGDKISQDWQEAIMGYENVESPSTGDQYQAPLNSYDPTGNDGPGYYRSLPDGGSEKLTESPP